MKSKLNDFYEISEKQVSELSTLKDAIKLHEHCIFNLQASIFDTYFRIMKEEAKKREKNEDKKQTILL